MKRTLIKTDSNGVQYFENEYFRSKWLALIITLLIGPFALLYSREYTAFWVLIIAYVIIALYIPSLNVLTIIVNIGLMGRFLFMSQDSFYQLVNRKG